MPILLHSVLFAACAAAGEDAMTTSASAAGISGNVDARIRDMVRFSTMIGLLEPVVDAALVRDRAANRRANDKRADAVSSCSVAASPDPFLDGLCVSCDRVLLERLEDGERSGPHLRRTVENPGAVDISYSSVLVDPAFSC